MSHTLIVYFAVHINSVLPSVWLQPSTYDKINVYQLCFMYFMVFLFLAPWANFESKGAPKGGFGR